MQNRYRCFGAKVVLNSPSMRLNSLSVINMSSFIPPVQSLFWFIFQFFAACGIVDTLCTSSPS